MSRVIRSSGRVKGFGIEQQRSLAKYLVAAAAVAGLLLVRLSVQAWFGLKGPYIQFFPAIMLAAWYGGWGPGVLATILSSVATAYYLLPPDGGAVADPADRLALILFSAIGVALTWLVHRLRSAEASAVARAQRLKTIIDTAVDAIIVIDANGSIEAFNKGAVKLFGYAEADVLGKNVSMLMPSPDREQHDGYLERYLRTREAHIIGKGRQVVGRKSDGRPFPLHLSVGEMVIDGQRKFTGILHDLSEQARIEEQLREHAALARIGEMAAVLAHEIKNPLAGIRAAVQIVREDAPEGHSQRALMSEVIGRIDSLDRLMKDLLLFARPPQPRLASIELADVVEATSAFAKHDTSLRDVHIDLDVRQRPVLSADAEMLRMAFHNILVNSAHAMNGQGRMTVRLDANGSACLLEFSDSGPGIPDDVRDKVFKPFFSTKAGGTGLGLPIARRIIEAHGGQISLQTPASGGTSVIIQLPFETRGRA